MPFFSSYAYLLRKSPVARTASWLVLIAAMAFLLTFLSRKSQKTPQIASISPQIAAAGDEMTITGANFGSEKGSSFVEISGSKVTEKAFLLWSDSEIRFSIPQNARDGLVFVGSSAGKSNPAFFVNWESIPQTMADSQLDSLAPAIDAVSPQSATVGQAITITGSAFGSVRGSSRVFFSASRLPSSAQDAGEELFIPPRESDFDYVSWSSSAITVKIPDGAASGELFVQTPSGKSVPEHINVDFPLGQKRLHDKKVYVIQLSADVLPREAAQQGELLLYVPRPALCSSQPECTLSDVSPEPFIADDTQNVIHRTQLEHLAEGGQHLTQTFTASVYAVEGGFKAKQVPSYKDKTGALYVKHTAATPLVPSDDESVQQLLQAITSGDKNPYTQAKAIYTYMTQNYEAQDKIRAGKVSELDLIRRKKGDSCDFATVYAALCRAAGIPAVPVSGILISGTGEAQVHWWNELYFESYGWLPVDAALGAIGGESESTGGISAAEFYFGNMDSRHVAFSRGMSEIKRANPSGKAVTRERTYAIQPFWEEAASSASYSVLWGNPVVLEVR